MGDSISVEARTTSLVARRSGTRSCADRSSHVAPCSRVALCVLQGQKRVGTYRRTRPQEPMAKSVQLACHLSVMESASSCLCCSSDTLNILSHTRQLAALHSHMGSGLRCRYRPRTAHFDLFRDGLLMASNDAPNLIDIPFSYLVLGAQDENDTSLHGDLALAAIIKNKNLNVWQGSTGEPGFDLLFQGLTICHLPMLWHTRQLIAVGLHTSALFECTRRCPQYPI